LEPEKQPEPKPSGGSSIAVDTDEEVSLALFRGVPSTSDQYANAVMGIAKPRGTLLDDDSLTLHIVGSEKANAGVTSWTIYKKYAQKLATREGTVSGIILEVDLLSVVDKIIPRPDNPETRRYSYEGEVLLKGTVIARPTPVMP